LCITGVADDNCDGWANVDRDGSTEEITVGVNDVNDDVVAERVDDSKAWDDAGVIIVVAIGEAKDLDKSKGVVTLDRIAPSIGAVSSTGDTAVSLLSVIVGRAVDTISL
jgi:hypothetical protein